MPTRPTQKAKKPYIPVPFGGFINFAFTTDEYKLLSKKELEIDVTVDKFTNMIKQGVEIKISLREEDEKKPCRLTLQSVVNGEMWLCVSNGATLRDAIKVMLENISAFKNGSFAQEVILQKLGESIDENDILF